MNLNVNDRNRRRRREDGLMNPHDIQARFNQLHASWTQAKLVSSTPSNSNPNPNPNLIRNPIASHVHTIERSSITVLSAPIVYKHDDAQVQQEEEDEAWQSGEEKSDQELDFAPQSKKPRLASPSVETEPQVIGLTFDDVEPSWHVNRTYVLRVLRPRSKKRRTPDLECPEQWIFYGSLFESHLWKKAPLVDFTPDLLRFQANRHSGLVSHPRAMRMTNTSPVYLARNLRQCLRSSFHPINPR
jgi:hypothetical protein